MGTIKIFDKTSTEYQRLVMAAALLEHLSPNGYKYEVDETYFDYGQDWKWTTIICRGAHPRFRSYQALNPREQEMIVSGWVEQGVAEVFADKYCPDRVKEV